MDSRDDVFALIAERIVAQGPDRAPLVAVDGVDGAGKTTFADGLAAFLDRAGRATVRISIDGFHRPRADRYRRGRDSAEGFYRDSFDVEALRAAVVDPLGPGGDGFITPAVFDHRTDTAVVPERIAAGDAVVVDGVFLQSAALDGAWDLVVFLDMPFEETFARMAVRDGCPADPDDPANSRYRDGQLLYLAERDPARRADIVVDNTDPQRPAVR